MMLRSLIVALLLLSTVGAFQKLTRAHGRPYGLRMIDASLAGGLAGGLHDATSLVTGLTDAWSVQGQGASDASLATPDVASNLFAVSLFPYLGLLFFLSRKPSSTPPLANFGFQFLLVFVFATIPAGIYAKKAYGDILANVDWLHGTAESLLSITNLLIIAGFRSVLQKDQEKAASGIDINRNFFLFGLLPLTLIFAVTATPIKAEPVNALSLPTWLVHSSSVLEWILAMQLVWQHAEVSGNPRWKGMTWGMLPSQASGLCACTYHFFFNTPLLNWMVTLQAALTLIGNTTMAFAAYRIFTYGEGYLMGPESALDDDKIEEVCDKAKRMITNTYEDTPFSLSLQGKSWWQQINTKVPVATTKQTEGDASFYLALFAKALVFASLIKYGELYFDFPFSKDPNLMAALFILVPTAMNTYQYVGTKAKEAVEASTSN